MSEEVHLWVSIDVTLGCDLSRLCYCLITYSRVELFHLNTPLVPSDTRFYPVFRLVDHANTRGRIVVQISYYFKIIEICKIRNFRPVHTKFTEFWYLPCIHVAQRARVVSKLLGIINLVSYPILACQLYGGKVPL